MYSKISFPQLTFRFSLSHCEPVHDMLPLPNSWLVECCVHLPSKHPGKTHLCVFIMSGIPSRGMTIVHMYIVRNGYVEGKLEFCVPEQVILEIMGEGLERELYLKDTEANTMY